MSIDSNELRRFARDTISRANRAIEKAKSADRIGHSPQSRRELNIALVAANEGRIQAAKELAERFSLSERAG